MNKKIIAYATVIQGSQSLLRSNPPREALDTGLRTNSDIPRYTIHETISNVSLTIETIIRGYGPGSRAVAGLENAQEPHTYISRRGWIKPGQGPSTDHEGLREGYGEAKARELARQLLKDYTGRLSPRLNNSSSGATASALAAQQSALNWVARTSSVPRKTV